MDLSDGSFHIVLEKNDMVVSKPVILEEVKTEVNDVKLPAEGKMIKSPLVGTFYQSPGTNQAPYVKVGDHVHIGDTVCIIESMKVMNELKADQEGKVVSIEVKDGQSVEFDQVLIILE